LIFVQRFRSSIVGQPQEFFGTALANTKAPDKSPGMFFQDFRSSKRFAGTRIAAAKSRRLIGLFLVPLFI